LASSTRKGRYRGGDGGVTEEPKSSSRFMGQIRKFRPSKHAEKKKYMVGNVQVSMW